MRIIVAVLLCACACQSAGAQAIHLRYAQAYSSLQTIFALPLLVAERNGYFVREGLDFSMLAVPGGGERLVSALDDGTADLAHVPTPYLIQASLAGSDAVAIAAEFNNPVYSFLAKPEIRTYADLKGKLIGLAAEPTSITISTRKLLALHGLRKEDFRSRFVDGTPERLICLTAGDCDAVPLGQPQDLFCNQERLSAARTFHRCCPRISLHRDSGPPLLGVHSQGHRRTLRPRSFVRIQVHP